MPVQLLSRARNTFRKALFIAAGSQGVASEPALCLRDVSDIAECGGGDGVSFHIGSDACAHWNTVHHHLSSGAPSATTVARVLKRRRIGVVEWKSLARGVRTLLAVPNSASVATTGSLHETLTVSVSSGVGLLTVGQVLRSIRERRGLSTRQIATRAAMSQAKLVRIELDRTVPLPEDVEMLLDVLRATSEDRRDLAAAGLRAGNGQGGIASYYAPAKSLQGEMLELYRSANAVHEFVAVCVPGMLQTAEYVRAVFSSIASMSQAEQSAGMVQRLERQRLLFEHGRSFTFLVVEDALRMPRFDEDVVKAQLFHLANLATLSNVEFGILTSFDSDLSVVFQFAIFDGQFVTRDFGDGFTLTRHRALVEQHVTTFEEFSQRALWGTDAVRVIRRMIDDIDAAAVVDLSGRPAFRSQRD